MAVLLQPGAVREGRHYRARAQPDGAENRQLENDLDLMTGSRRIICGSLKMKLTIESKADTLNYVSLEVNENNY